MSIVRSSWWERVRGRGKESPRLRLFLWATILGLIFGAVEFGQPVEDALRTARNALQRRPASGEIVLVAIDDRALQKIDRWPWPRRHYGQLAANLHKLGARRIFLDLDFSSRSDPKEDRLLEAGLASAGGKVTLAVQSMVDPVTGSRSDLFPQPRLRRHVGLATINVEYDWRGYVWSLPRALDMQGKAYPSFAAALGRKEGVSGTTFRLDYSIDPRSVPLFSAIDVLDGQTPAAAVRGKDVIIGTTSRQLGDTYPHPALGLISGVYLHILGAETLRSGTPQEFGWVPGFAVALLFAALTLRLRSLRFSGAVSIAGVAILAAVPFGSEPYLVYVDIVPGLFLLLLVGSVDAWRKFKHSYRVRSRVNAVSGLPNLNALRQGDVEQARTLVAARVQNYAQITSALPASEEKSVVDQIVARLTVGRSSDNIYHGDEGIFVWFCEHSAVPDHLDALHALLRSPVVAAGSAVDLTISFGIDNGSDRSIANRLGSALVAADEAATEGLRWKEYDPAKLKDATWKLSLLSQLDAAIDSGDLWVAYQPKLDLSTRQIIGAEALVRWTHPEKGAISPIEFIIAAEQSDRIQRLTTFVLDQAIGRAAALNARGIEFEISVNLSARLIDDPTLPFTVTKLLQKHGLPPSRLTLEVTETVAITGSGSNFQTLHQLRESGVQLSIDDYGTGLSTLEYLKKIPATEIKIDRTFIQSVGNSRGDMLMVHSTIQLAHSLGQKVVAEGVEHGEALELLAKLGCDVAQGYFIGKPATFRALSREVLAQTRRRAA